MKALRNEFASLKKVSENAEMRSVLTALNQALADDKTGELSEIFRLARRATMN
jgi:hypothetical protein